MDSSLSESASQYLDALYDEYEHFDVQQTTLSVSREEFGALESGPDGAELHVRIEGSNGVLSVPDGDGWALPGGLVDEEPKPETVAELIERQTGVRCEIDGLNRVSLVCLQCDAVDRELWALSALFSGTPIGGSVRNGAAWRERAKPGPLVSAP